MKPKTINENSGKKLLLLGTASSVFEPDYDKYDEIWAVGSAFGAAHKDIKRVTLGFEIHPIERMMKISKERQIDYKKFNCPILVQDANDERAKELMGNPITFPLPELIAYTVAIGAARFFTSSFCYMLVYAAMMGYKEIDIYKILLTNESEYFLQRPGVEYWLEWLGHQEDIIFYFPEDAEMTSNTALYGYEEQPRIWRLESRKKFLWEMHAQCFYQLENLSGLLNRATGMIEMFSLFQTGKEDQAKKVAEICRKQIQDQAPNYTVTKDKYMQFNGALQSIQHTETRS